MRRIAYVLASCVTVQDEDFEQVIEDSRGRALICMTNKDIGSEKTSVVHRIVTRNNGPLI
jgi:hypothetical protein